jgi:hypothetical protein
MALNPGSTSGLPSVRSEGGIEATTSHVLATGDVFSSRPPTRAGSVRPAPMNIEAPQPRTTYMETLLQQPESSQTQTWTHPSLFPPVTEVEDPQLTQARIDKDILQNQLNKQFEMNQVMEREMQEMRAMVNEMRLSRASQTLTERWRGKQRVVSPLPSNQDPPAEPSDHGSPDPSEGRGGSSPYHNCVQFTARSRKIVIL